MYSKFFFKVGDRHEAVDWLRQFLYGRFYVKSPQNKICSIVFDGSMDQMIADYQQFNGLSKAGSSMFNFRPSTSLLNEATYAQIGSEMSAADIDRMSRNEPDLKRLLYGVSSVDVCGLWPAVAAIIPKDKFIGWGHPNVTQNCFDYCKAQLKEVGNEMKSAWWGPADKMNAHIYQLYLTQDVAGMKKGYQVKQFTDGVVYLKNAIQAKIPVVVGVEDGPGSPNADKVTDHFVVVVGMGSDAKGKYFLFYDNATGNKDEGTSDENRLYCYCDEFMLKGTAANDYARGSDYKSYIATQIRESK